MSAFGPCPETSIQEHPQGVPGSRHSFGALAGQWTEHPSGLRLWLLQKEVCPQDAQSSRTLVLMVCSNCKLGLEGVEVLTRSPWHPWLGTLWPLQGAELLVHVWPWDLSLFPCVPSTSHLFPLPAAENSGSGQRLPSLQYLPHLLFIAGGPSYLPRPKP